MASSPRPRQPDGATGLLALADGTLVWGRGAGAEGSAVGELCFNTAMTGYQEVMTDPSYAKQIVTFTFPHVGNVGANLEDVEATNPHAVGCVLAEPITAPSNFRSAGGFDRWLANWGRIALTGVDTRALTRLIRQRGAPNATIVHAADGRIDADAAVEAARAWSGLEGLDLAREVSATQSYRWGEGPWALGSGYGDAALDESAPHVVAVDYGAKRAILRQLVDAGARVTVVPATATFEEIAAHKPDGLFLSNGPGDPAATGEYAVPMIREWLGTGKPLFGICLGHQLLGLALGGATSKMHQGHRGANHPVKRLSDGKVEITSMNHGFAVDAESLPADVRATHVSLFDGSLAGLETADGRAFGVQHHPEASPGPQDSYYLFKKFVKGLR
jgi:carbamoyl-phosphate synthase small subunit